MDGWGASSVALSGRVRVLLLELELELPEELAVPLLVGLLVLVEGEGRLQAPVHHERVVQHGELVAGHVQLAHLEGGKKGFNDNKYLDLL